MLEVMSSIPAAGEEKLRCPNMFSLVSFAGMTLDKFAVLRIGTLTGGPLCRESHPMCRLKNPTVINMITCWLSSCKTGVYNERLVIILERGCSSMFRKKERLNKSYTKRAVTSFFKRYPCYTSITVITIYLAKRTTTTSVYLIKVLASALH